MEPGIFNQLKRYFQAGGAPEQVIELLSKNYQAYAQMANLMAEWIISAGESRGGLFLSLSGRGGAWAWLTLSSLLQVQTSTRSVRWWRRVSGT